MTYRIVKVVQCKKEWFEVERKWFFWWLTETYFDCCSDGLCAGDYPFEFNTKAEAEEYICNQFTKKSVC